MEKEIKNLFSLHAQLKYVFIHKHRVLVLVLTAHVVFLGQAYRTHTPLLPFEITLKGQARSSQWLSEYPVKDPLTRPFLTLTLLNCPTKG